MGNRAVRGGRVKGTRKTGGRKKGTPNKATVEAKAACAAIVDDPVYRRKLKAAALARELPPVVETMLWHYAKGKPKERVEHSGHLELANLESIKGMSDEEIVVALRVLKKLAGRAQEAMS